ncbi:MAG: hypothetical protein H6557_24250 [Lewinellaceae bacterium]|nr:hypothetical protein [Phaeodactylibacter sp.]MCB9039742.1 hypothetical protein [Lewinellaceae bacterium]
MAATATLTADAIIFTINSAIKLSHNIRRAYAQSIRAKTLSLPLPEFDTEIKFNTALDFFDGHPQYPERVERLAKLHLEADENLLLPEEKEREYLEYYRAFHALHLGRDERPDVNAEDLVNLFRIRQWEHGKEHHTVLQLVAGTLVELGIDYFIQTPGALNAQSAQGRIVRNFLLAFDEIDFSESKDIKLEISNRLVPPLFAAAAESFAGLSPDIADDEKLQLFIKETAKGIARDLYRRAENQQGAQRREAAYWGQMVLRSMINNAGAFVFSAPEALFDTNRPVSRIIQSTGLTLLDAILGDDSGQIQWQKAITADTLDRLAKAALEVVAEHPNVISGKQGIREIIGGIAHAVKDESFQQQGLIPELARIVLEQSAGNLERLWRTTPSGPEHLLVSAVQQLLSALSEKHGDAPWRPALTKGHLLALANDLLEEVAQNPSWITDKANQDSILAEILDISFRSLSRIPREERLNAEAVRWLIRLNLQTALASRQVLDKLKWGSDAEEVVILEKALELAFGCVFPQETPPRAGRLELLAELTEYILDAVLRRHPGRRGLVLADLILFEKNGIDYSRGFNEALADQFLHSALDVLAQHPELAARNESLRLIVGEIANALKDSGINRPELLPEMIRLTLEYTAMHFDLVFDTSKSQPKHLLVLATREVLKAIAEPPRSGKWKPRLSNEQILEILEIVFDAVTEYPQWIQAEELIYLVLEAIYRALEAVSSARKLPFFVIRRLFESALKIACRQRQFIVKIQTRERAHKQIMLRYSLESLFIVIYDENDEEESSWRLTQAEVASSIVDYYLELIAKTPGSKEDVGRALGQIRLAIAKWKQDFSKTLEEVLETLDIENL